MLFRCSPLGVPRANGYFFQLKKHCLFGVPSVKTDVSIIHCMKSIATGNARPAICFLTPKACFLVIIPPLTLRQPPNPILCYCPILFRLFAELNQSYQVPISTKWSIFIALSFYIRIEPNGFFFFYFIIAYKGFLLIYQCPQTLLIHRDKP